ncbi:hypothetical protein KIPB_008785, partial [Kipferlia bialata]
RLVAASGLVASICVVPSCLQIESKTAPVVTGKESGLDNDTGSHIQRLHPAVLALLQTAQYGQSDCLYLTHSSRYEHLMRCRARHVRQAQKDVGDGGAKDDEDTVSSLPMSARDASSGEDLLSTPGLSRMGTPSLRTIPSQSALSPSPSQAGMSPYMPIHTGRDTQRVHRVQTKTRWTQTSASIAAYDTMKSENIRMREELLSLKAILKKERSAALKSERDHVEQMETLLNSQQRMSHSYRRGAKEQVAMRDEETRRVWKELERATMAEEKLKNELKRERERKRISGGL